MHAYVHCSTICNSKDMESTQMPINDWILKMWYVYTMKYCAAIKKNKIMSFAGTWMELEAIILSKPRQEHKTKYCMFSLINGNQIVRRHIHKEGNSTHWDLPMGQDWEEERGSEKNNYWVLDLVPG